MSKKNPSTRSDANPALLDWLWSQTTHWLARARKPLLLGISGLQASGKSTLAKALVERARTHKVPAITLSLDDFYLTRRERQVLAREVHPLLATRGVPGTHDLALLDATLESLSHASSRRPAPVPRFDKAHDTRRPPSRWPRLQHAPRLIVLEGWCLGVAPQSQARLRAPANALERREDADRRWRTWVNDQLRCYQSLWQRFDSLVVLRAPNWQVIRRWRGEAEAKLRAQHQRRFHTMDTKALERFLQHYERLSRHALATLSARADVLVQLDTRRRPRSIRTARRSATGR
jgi:D-glycerate 3-kinase